MNEKYSRIVTVAGRTFHQTATMADIFLAHASDVIERGETQAISLVHAGGVDMVFVGPASTIHVTDADVSTLSVASARTQRSTAA